MKEELAKTIWEQCQASYLKIHNDSEKHAGHKGGPQNGNSHFTVRVSSPLFEGKSLVNRHKLVYACCDSFFKQGLHALALETLTDEELEKKYGQ